MLTSKSQVFLNNTTRITTLIATRKSKADWYAPLTKMQPCWSLSCANCEALRHREPSSRSSYWSHRHHLVTLRSKFASSLRLRLSVKRPEVL